MAVAQPSDCASLFTVAIPPVLPDFVGDLVPLEDDASSTCSENTVDDGAESDATSVVSDHEETDKPTLRNFGVFVRGFSEHIGEKELREAFTHVGEVVSCRVIRDPISGRSQKYGFVNFRTEEAVERALAMNGQIAMGQVITVRNRHYKEAGTKKTDVYVGNIPKELSEEELKKALEKFTGPCMDLRIMGGYCFMSFPGPEAARRAQGLLHGRVVNGKAIYAQPGKQRRDGMALQLNLALMRVVLSGACRLTPQQMHLLEKAQRTLYVGNLHHITTAHTLREYFSPYGRVVKTNIVVDPRSGVKKGYGFVEYSAFDEAARALVSCEQAGGAVIDNQQVTIQISTPPKDVQNRLRQAGLNDGALMQAAATGQWQGAQLQELVKMRISQQLAQRQMMTDNLTPRTIGELDDLPPIPDANESKGAALKPQLAQLQSAHQQVHQLQVLRQFEKLLAQNANTTVGRQLLGLLSQLNQPQPQAPQVPSPMEPSLPVPAALPDVSTLQDDLLELEAAAMATPVPVPGPRAPSPAMTDLMFADAARAAQLLSTEAATAAMTSSSPPRSRTSVTPPTPMSVASSTPMPYGMPPMAATPSVYGVGVGMPGVGMNMAAMTPMPVPMAATTAAYVQPCYDPRLYAQQAAAAQWFAAYPQAGFNPAAMAMPNAAPQPAATVPSQWAQYVHPSVYGRVY